MLGSTRIRYLPTKAPRQQRARATYESILDAAARILQTAGFEGLTTNHVADRAGVAIGSLYEYFPDKETIVAEVTRRTLREMLEEIAGGVKASLELGGEEGLRLGLRLLFDAVEKRRALVRALWQVPFLNQIEEVNALPRSLLALTARSLPRAKGSVFDRNPEASSYLLTVMVANAVVQSAAARPRHLSREEVEETLAEMVRAVMLREA